MNKQYIFALLLINLSSIHATGSKFLMTRDNGRRTPSPEVRERDAYFKQRDAAILNEENKRRTQESKMQARSRSNSPSPARRSIQPGDKLDLNRALCP